MRRLPFHLFSLASLLLLLACAILWPRSHFAQDEYTFGARPLGTRTDPVTGETAEWAAQYRLAAAHGRIQVLRTETQLPKAARGGWNVNRDATLFALDATRSVDRSWAAAGVEYFHRPRHSYKEGDMTFSMWGFRYLTVPFWLITPALAALPILWVVSERRRQRERRRRRAGLCPACGYDLRATADRCPECGAATAMA